jgi:hypothetical protein
MALPTVSITQYGHKHYTNVHLVRGIGRRAIRVIVRPFNGGAVDEFALVLIAAERAATNGWATIVVMPDCIDGDTAYTVNLSQFHMWYEFQEAKFLAFSDFDRSSLPKHLYQASEDGDTDDESYFFSKEARACRNYAD